MLEPKTKPARQGTVRLPTARLEQLRTLGAVLNLSVADVIGYMVGKEIAAGVIANVIPGVNVSREGTATLLSFENGEPVRMKSDEAAHVVQEIRVRVQGSETGQAVRAMADTQTVDFGLRPISILRKGKGINIRVRDQMKSFSPALATELADLIEKTAA